jgi:Flp pilus assembly secretin CpaC
MRYLSFLVAVLASAPVCAAEFTEKAAGFTDKIELRPGFAERWQAPRPFKNVILGDPDIVGIVQGQTDQELIIIKTDGGTTNIALTDENGKQVANVLVTNEPEYQQARSTETGSVQLYRNDGKCYPDCIRPTKHRERTKRDDTAAQSNALQPNSQGK